MTLFLLAATSGTKSQSSVDSVLITLDLVYGGTFVLAGYLKVAYHFFFRILNGRWPRTHILRYWLALAAFITASLFWMPMGAFWIFQDIRDYVRARVHSPLLQVLLGVP